MSYEVMAVERRVKEGKARTFKDANELKTTIPRIAFNYSLRRT
jgi:hypothetical protein